MRWIVSMARSTGPSRVSVQMEHTSTLALPWWFASRSTSVLAPRLENATAASHAPVRSSAMMKVRAREDGSIDIASLSLSGDLEISCGCTPSLYSVNLSSILAEQLEA